MKILSSVCQTSMSFSILFKTLGPVENTLFSLVNSSKFISEIDQSEKRIFNQWKSSLKKCHIEGIEATNSNFDSIVESIKRKPYDILDHRKVLRNSYNLKYVTVSWNFIVGEGSRISPDKAPKGEVIFENSMTSKGRIIFRRRDMTAIWHSENCVTTIWRTPLSYDYRIFIFEQIKFFWWF